MASPHSISCRVSYSVYKICRGPAQDDDPYRNDRGLDLIISGPDAVKARKKASSRYADVFGAVDERPGRYAYDVQADKAEALIEQFMAVCDKSRLDARVEVEPERVPLSERARRCVADKGQGSYTIQTGLESYEVFAVAGLPTDRPLEVTAEAGEESMIWKLVEVMRNEYRPGVGRLVKPGSLPVDSGAIIAGDAGAVGSIDVTNSVDGLSDIEIETRTVGDGGFPLWLRRTTDGATPYLALWTS